MKSSSSLSMEEIGERVVVLLLAIQAISVFLLWTLDPLTSHDQDAFALYLAIAFVAFAMMSYLYRALSDGRRFSTALIIVGCAFIAALILINSTLPG